MWGDGKTRGDARRLGMGGCGVMGGGGVMRGDGVRVFCSECCVISYVHAFLALLGICIC